MQLRLGGLIRVGGQDIALGRTAALLDAVAATGSVSGAAERLGLSYRTAWGRIEELQAAFGEPLVAKTKGHGSTLTPLGKRLREQLAAVRQVFEGPIAEAEASLVRALNALLAAPRSRLRLALSHDPLIAEALAGLEGEVEATTTGSAEALARLASGEADVAGFHYGAGPPPPGSAFAGALADPALEAVPLLRREQGLLLAPGNPLGVRSLADLATSGARLVNRQRGSGTRLWFDQLLQAAGLGPGDLRGYGTEEFTHQAVAAVVASGAADAGMGVRAAAERFGLDFLALGAETYFLAARAGSADARLERLVTAVRTLAASAPGYGPPG